MSEVFLSYAREDRTTAEKFAKVLEAEGHSIFWDRHIAPGDTWDEVLARELKSARCVIVLWSRRSVASRWVKAEASEAAERSMLLPALIEETEIPFQFKSIQTVDLTDWDGGADHPAMQGLLASVQRAKNAGQRSAGTAPANPKPARAPRTRWRRIALCSAVLVMLAVSATTFYGIGKSKGWFALKVPYHTYLMSSEGLAVGDDVLLDGKPVGKITLIELGAITEDNNVVVAFSVRDPYWAYIWNTSRAKVQWNPSKQKRHIHVTRGTAAKTNAIVVQSFKVAKDEGTVSFWDERSQKYLTLDEAHRWGYTLPAEEEASEP